MDDPWGSPWATDDVPTINLPAAPPPATLSSHGNNSPRVSISSPWQQQNEDDAWGGWNEAPSRSRSGTSSPGWGRSPGLKPAVVREREVSPGPWVGRRSEERGGDSAIVLNEKDRKASVVDDRDISRRGSNGSRLQAELKPEQLSTNEGSSTLGVESPARSASPEIPPPGQAERVEGRPEPVRSASKVQELVYMYDGFAKKSVSPAQSALASPPPQKLRDAGSGDDEETELAVSPTDVAQGKDLDVEPAFEASESERPETAIVTNGWPEDTTTEAPTPSSPPRTRTRIDIPFPVDLSNLDALFPSTPHPTVTPEPLPDIIIDDTFTAISERKTWYRISRYGSMLKHNTGNDDNYVRMDWTRSAARDKSLRIVRRWMEEDSIAGRVNLGARQKGAVGGSMFNWDTKAEPVDVGELLGRKKGHERKASKGEMTSSVGATFGWSSQGTSPTATSFPAPFQPKDNGSGAKSRPQSLIMPPQSGIAKPIHSPVQPKTRPQSLIMPPAQAMNRPSIDQALAAPSLTATRDGPKRLELVENDDDDWGEMVSSPTVPTVGAFAGPDGSDTNKPVNTGVASPTAAEFGLSSSPVLSKTSLEDTKPSATSKPLSSAKPVDGAVASPTVASFAWDGSPVLSKTSPKALVEAQVQTSASSFGWDDLGKPSHDVQLPASTTAPAPAPQPSAATFGWNDLDMASQDAKTPIPTSPPVPVAEAFGWDNFEKPSVSPTKAISAAGPQPSADDNEWDDFEQPPQDGTREVHAEPLHPPATTSGLSGFESAAPATPEEPSTTKGQSTDIWAPEPTGGTKLPTSPTLASPQSPVSATLSLASPQEMVASPLPSQPQPSTDHTETPLPTMEQDDAVVGQILNDLPDLSYMLR